MIHWCISIPLASCSSHPSIFVQSVCHSRKSWRHWLIIINFVFIQNNYYYWDWTLPCMKYFWLCVICNSYMYRHFNWLNLAFIQGINTGSYDPISLPLHFLFLTWSEEVSLFLFLDFYPLASQTQFSLQMICTAHQGNYH